MTTPTISWDADQRPLTQRPDLAPCPKCGGYRLPSPRWVVEGDVHREVDCAGNVIREVRP
jgi:hypothetical protein